MSLPVLKKPRSKGRGFAFSYLGSARYDNRSRLGLIFFILPFLAVFLNVAKCRSVLFRCKFDPNYLFVIYLRIVLLVLITSFGGLRLHAQIRPDSLPSKPDTSKPKIPLRIVSFSPENLDFGNRTIQDSLHYTLDSFQIVHPFLISTGNLGSPAHYLIPRYTPTEAFSVRPDAFSYFGFNRDNRRFYNTNQPYTLLQYFVGQRREQYVDVLHTRNFGENLNFSFHFMRARSEGFYRRQNTSNTSLQTNLWYKSPGKRYAFMADVFWTGVNVAENGGLENDSTFEYGNQIDRQVNEINLDRAGTVQRKRDIWMKHTFALGKVSDTLVLDSAHSYNVITPAWGISIISELYDEKYNYQDDYPTSGFYDVIYRDSTITQDSTYCWRVNNSVRLEKFNQYGAKKLWGYVGVRHEAGEYFNDTIYTHLQNFYAEAFVRLDFDRHVQLFCSRSHRVYNNWLEAGGWYVLSGYNSGDYKISLNGTFTKGYMWSMTVNGEVAALSPGMIFRNYSGNHLRWENTFFQVKRNLAELLIRRSSRKSLIQFSARVMNESNGLYFDSTFLPAQTQDAITSYSFSVMTSWEAGWFNSATRFVYSRTSNNAIIRLPEMLVQHTMYANLKIFKNAMQLQAGIDVTWFSEFTAEAYMPNVAQFYLHNDRTVGNYTYISPWVSFRIKPVRVFVKVDHVNAGLMGRKYFLLDHYPANDMAVKIGISWLFND